MAAQRIQHVFGKFVRIFPELFPNLVRIVKGTTETVVVDKAEEGFKNLVQDIRPSNQQDEKSPSQEEAAMTSSSYNEPKQYSEPKITKPEFKKHQ